VKTPIPALQHWSPPRGYWWLLLIGLGLRLGYACTVDAEAAFGGWDGREYHAYAQFLGAFRGDDYPRFFNSVRAPFYPVFLIPFVKLSVTAIWPIQMVQSLLGVLQAWTLAVIAGRWAGQRAGTWALVIGLFHPFLIYFCAFVLTENLFITLLWLGIACLQQLALNPKGNVSRWTIWGAVAIGLGTLTRPALQPFLVVAVLWLGWCVSRTWGWGAALLRMTQFTATVCALLLPWMIGNFVVHRELSLSVHGAQLVYAQSNSPDYLLAYEAKTKDAYYQALTRLHHRFAIVGGSAPEGWLEEGNAFRRDHPAEWRRLQWHKIRHFWTPWLNPLIFPRSLFLVSVLAITPLFALAAAELWRRRPRQGQSGWDGFLWLLLGLVAVGFLVGGLMFHVQVRYRIPFVDIVFIVLSAAWLGAVLPGGRRKGAPAPGRPAKVLWISCVAEKGGAEVYMLNLIRHLNPARHQSGIALLRPGPLVEELAAAGIPAHVLRQHRMREVGKVARTIWDLRQLILREDYDLVHSNGFRAHVYGGLAAQLAGVPEIWSVHTVEKPGPSTSLILAIPTTFVTANCERTAGYFVAQGLPTNMIWPGVDLQRIEQGTAREELMGRHGLPAGVRWIAMGARLQRYKGHEYFLRALAALPAPLNEIHGVIMGGSLFGMEQTYLEELKRLASSLGISGRVHFTGFISDADVYGFVRHSELLMHPALDEDFGLIVAEAQALGRPVLAFASVGPAAIVADGITGRLVPVGDQARLSQGLAEMLGAPDQLGDWGEEARVRARRLFGAETMAGQLERVYQTCAPPAEKLP
jgi:glycosyltransferase involved in cell wall biosynthesis/4-amino-4-deoxy-L-arabinose transferase-like glycosyltransferase